MFYYKIFFFEYILNFYKIIHVFLCFIIKFSFLIHDQAFISISDFNPFFLEKYKAEIANTQEKNVKMRVTIKRARS